MSQLKRSRNIIVGYFIRLRLLFRWIATTGHDIPDDDLLFEDEKKGFWVI